MSYLDTKQALVQKLLGTAFTDIAVSDISYENNDFDPTGKSAFIACYFIPASSEIMGKASTSNNEDRGIFQVSVYVNLNGGKYDNKQLKIVDEILSDFVYNSQSVYNGQTVQILESTVNTGSENESWFKRDVSINYLTFSERL
jgi:hypothetical protein